MDDLERELRDLSPWLHTPAAPELTGRVRARIAVPAPWWRRWRYYLAPLLVALLVAVLPPGRAALADAVAGLLRFAGVNIATAPAPAPPAGDPSPLPSQRSLSLEEAQRQVRFPLRVPAGLGPPEQVLVADPDDTGACRVATLVFRGGALRLDAFDGRVDPVYLKRVDEPGTEWVQVDGAFAVWVAGPHDLTYVDRTGVTRVETARLAASTLIWEEAGVTYRLEGDLPKAEALGIATSLW
ncbi:hypothetical protein E1211_16160 [Micromonospora sp. 15K316]|uniref:hypothetical protein n=1 Tax=Micromonospora sp. 15K316 TaxID=2530376 RepID=UPI0010531FE1|nr:hypothetical protein [Micromonospora sp. 15K316]TDC35156.1 hypothetical protein E1211_16160 [Micromonospora sp. 15K316]